MSIMKNIRVEKVTLNIGAGKSADKLEKGMKLIKMLTGIEPIKTITKKRIPGWGVRPGLPVGCKLTLRKKKATEVFEILVKAKDNILALNNFDEKGNLAFGLHEYIDIPGIKYSPEIGIMGLQICVTFERPGFRVKKRKKGSGKISAKHELNKEEVMKYVMKNFNVKIKEGT
ncbi:50S ribosomal protein L5 [Candidatus Woesearchaeota archaeon]|nr:50S ribosomal protein L5 [Candidatus Woesearchaeota archaeon]